LGRGDSRRNEKKEDATAIIAAIMTIGIIIVVPVAGQ
jgi:hypothetical protein